MNQCLIRINCAGCRHFRTEKLQSKLKSLCCCAVTSNFHLHLLCQNVCVWKTTHFHTKSFCIQSNGQNFLFFWNPYLIQDRSWIIIDNVKQVEQKGFNWLEKETHIHQSSFENKVTFSLHHRQQWSSQTCRYPIVTIKCAFDGLLYIGILSTRHTATQKIWLLTCVNYCWKNGSTHNGVRRFDDDVYTIDFAVNE